MRLPGTLWRRIRAGRTESERVLLVLASDAIFYVLFAFTVFAVLLSVGLALFALAWSVTRAGGARAAPRARIERARY